MKVVINEKQMKLIVDKLMTKRDISEEGEAAAYPEVGKWESGVTRGPANQVGNTKWSEVVTINRGKANPLK